MCVMSIRHSAQRYGRQPMTFRFKGHGFETTLHCVGYVSLVIDIWIVTSGRWHVLPILHVTSLTCLMCCAAVYLLPDTSS